MYRAFLQTKIYPLRVTAKALSYDGSLGLSRDVIQAAGLAPGQRVLVANLSNGSRFETYLLEESEEGVCSLKGGTARLGEIGDELIAMFFALVEPSEQPLTPTVLKVDSHNKIIKRL